MQIYTSRKIKYTYHTNQLEHQNKNLYFNSIYFFSAGSNLDGLFPFTGNPSEDAKTLN